MGQSNVGNLTLDYATPKRLQLEWRFMRLSAANLLFILGWLAFNDCSHHPFAARWDWIWKCTEFNWRELVEAHLDAEMKIIHSALILFFLNVAYVLALSWWRGCSRPAFAIYLAISFVPLFLLALIEIFYPSLGLA